MKELTHSGWPIALEASLVAVLGNFHHCSLSPSWAGFPGSFALVVSRIPQGLACSRHTVCAEVMTLNFQGHHQHWSLTLPAFLRKPSCRGHPQSPQEPSHDPRGCKAGGSLPFPDRTPQAPPWMAGRTPAEAREAV